MTLCKKLCEPKSTPEGRGELEMAKRVLSILSQLYLYIPFINVQYIALKAFFN